ncbi:MAG TPA: Yip1 family protein [Rudaea sp.]|nr:Yip1 family protein [Rudaea sp.]
MDFNKLIARVKNILLAPKTEWPVIAGETETVQSLYLNYILVLAAIPAVFGFIKNSIIGTSFFGVTVHAGIGAGITGMIVYYVLSLVMVFVMALIIDALAGTFGAQKNQVQALKTVAYAYTASWIAGIAAILGVLGALVMLAGGIYSIYLLYLALPNTMKCPPDKAGGYTAVSIICAIVLGWILMLVVASFTGAAMFGAGAMHLGSSSINLDGSGSSVSIDSNSALGKLAEMGQKMDAASKKMESAQKSGDANAQAQAAGQMLGTVLGGGSQVEALAPDALKGFVPDTLAGLKRTSVSAERNGAMGMQVSNANATYTDGQHTLHLEIADTGSAKGIMALAGAVGVESDHETDHGYDKTYKQDGRLVHEQWDTQGKYGEFSIVLGDRFSVKVSGNADSIDQLKAAVGSVNLAGLEALKNQGVKSQ